MKTIVIGAVAGGMSTAAKLKRNLKENVDIIVYEKNDEISFGACGIPFYVSDHIKSEEQLIERTVSDFEQQGIDVRIFHEVLSVNSEEKTILVHDKVKNATFTDNYDKLVIASGASPCLFPPLDKPYKNLTVIRNVKDGTKTKKALQKNSNLNVVIVGGGFIGIEMAEACRTYGAKVTIIDLSKQILSSFDPEISLKLQEELTRNNVNLLLNSKVVDVTTTDNTINSITVDVESVMKEIPCDFVINCGGIKPVTDYIKSVNKHDNGGILVNEDMSTNIPDVYAAGDCSVMKHFITQQPYYAPLGTNANKQGRIIADVLSGIPPKPFKLLGSSAIKVFALDAAKVGLSEKEAHSIGLKIKTNMVTANSYASYYGKDKIDIKLVYDEKTKVILGAQCVGQGSVVARCNYFAVAIANKMTTEEFGFSDLCYSPPFSGVWDATLISANTAK